LIWNIVDRRAREYRWAKVNAVIEDVAHDNSCADADQAETDMETSVTYEERRSISLHEAVRWAEDQPGRVTLYLYDEGAGI